MRITSIIYSLCVFVLVSCSPKEETPSTEKVVENENTNEPDPSACNTTSHQIYKKTVEMWHASWLWAMSSNESNQAISYTFSHQNLEELETMFQETTGLRMYYALNEGDSIPMVALVNLSGCNDQFQSNENSVLLSDQDGGHFISTDDAAELTANWQSYACTKRQFYTPVNAYNYDWNIIHYLQGLGINSEQELHVSFGLRSISPGDEWFDPQGLTHKGSIVYVNILHGASLLANMNHNFDFTMPCPQYCDANSPLINLCNN